MSNATYATYDPYRQPAHAVQQAPQAPRSGGKANFLVGCIVLGLLGYMAYGYTQTTDGPRDQQQQQATPDSEPATASLKDSFVVVVTESKGRPVPVVSALNQFSFWREYIPGKGMRWYLLDPEDSDATSYVDYANSQNMKPPFVVHVVRPKSGGVDVKWIDKFPPANYDPGAPDLSTYKKQIEE